MGLMDKLGEAAKAAQGLSGGAEGVIKTALEEYKKTTAVLEVLGVTVGGFTIEMGILPAIHRTLSIQPTALRFVRRLRPYRFTRCNGAARRCA